MSENLAATVEAVRTFNRSYTPRIGVLDDSFLGTGQSLGAARLMFEIGVEGASVLELRRRLQLDSGYVSRLLRRLEASGAATVEPDPADRRRRIARLTARGRRMLRTLDDRSEQVATRLVAPLSPRQRDELADALAKAERLVRLATIRFEVVDAATSAAQDAVGAYFAEIDARFANGFDPGDALTADVAAYAPAAGGAFVLARSDDQVVACGGLMRVDARTVEIKRMWVHTDWRGGGLGRRMLSSLEEQAAQLGYRRAVLDTNGALVEAIRMYEQSGYTPTERYNDNPYAERWFEKRLRRRRPG